MLNNVEKLFCILECNSEYNLTTCDDGQCIPVSTLCDGANYCVDYSDEISQCGEFVSMMLLEFYKEYRFIFLS